MPRGTRPPALPAATPWERVLIIAARVARTPDDADLAALLASEIYDFDKAMRAGLLRLPASWEPAAVHLAGYEMTAAPGGPREG